MSKSDFKMPEAHSKCIILCIQVGRVICEVASRSVYVQSLFEICIHLEMVD